MPHLLTTAEVAETFKVSPWTVYRWARSGRLRCIRVSPRKLLFAEKDLAALLDSSKAA